MISLKTISNVLDKLIIVIMVALPYFLSIKISMFITIGVSAVLMIFQYYLLRKDVIKTFPKMIDVTVLVLSIAILIADYYVPDENRKEFEKMIPLFVYGSFFVMAFVSILFSRPFTMQYAKNSVPKAVWQRPEFLEINEKITYVWLVAFLLMAGSSAIPLMFTLSNTMEIIFTAVLPTVLIFLARKYRGGR